MKNNSISSRIIYILLPLAVGAISAALSQISGYDIMIKPAFSPPAFLFPVVWTILYVLMGISSYGIATSHSPQKEQALLVYGLQLFVNFFWSIIFFRLDAYLLAFFWLLLLIVLIIVMIWKFYQINKTAAYLQIPYLLWCLFAAVLNFSIYVLNR